MDELTKSAPQEYRCPVHSTKLLYVLRGGAGFCRSCWQYVQAAGVPMPTLDRPKPKKKAKAKRKAKAKPKAKKARPIKPRKPVEGVR